MPVFVVHPRKHAVAGDAGVVDHDIDRAEFLGHPRAPVDTRLVIAHVPFVRRGFRCVGEGPGLDVVARVVRDDRAPCAFNARLIASPIPRVPPVTLDTFHFFFLP